MTTQARCRLWNSRCSFMVPVSLDTCASWIFRSRENVVLPLTKSAFSLALSLRQATAAISKKSSSYLDFSVNLQMIGTLQARYSQLRLMTIIDCLMTRPPRWRTAYVRQCATSSRNAANQRSPYWLNVLLQDLRRLKTLITRAYIYRDKTACAS
jgi:hypothetical protein